MEKAPILVTSGVMAISATSRISELRSSHPGFGYRWFDRDQLIGPSRQQYFLA